MRGGEEMAIKNRQEVRADERDEDKAGGLSFARKSLAADDLFVGTGLTEDNVSTRGTVVLDVLSNDRSASDRKLYSLDDGDRLDDLLKRDTARNEAGSTDRSAHGATIWITPDGEVGYDAGTLSADFKTELQGLAQGEYIEDTFLYALGPNEHALSWAKVGVRIAGINDAPVVTPGAQAGEVREDAVLRAIGQVGAIDIDHGDHLRYSVRDGAGTYGALSLDAITGAWTYSLSNDAGNVQALAEGERQEERFAVRATDDFGAFAEQEVVVNVLGTNDAPLASADAYATGEDDPLIVAAPVGLLANDADVDGDTLSVSSTGPITSILGANVTLNADGSFTYDSRNAGALQSLNDGESAEDSFAYLVSDGMGATSTAVVHVHVTGATDNHAPIIVSGAQDRSVEEDATLRASGQVRASDPDAGDHLRFGMLGSGLGEYGSLAVDRDTGEWTYTLRNDADYVQALNRAERHDESFVVYVSDDAGAVAMQQVFIAVYGANDAPVAVDDTAAGLVSELLWIDVLANDTDIDNGHVLSIVSAAVPEGQGSLLVADGRLALDPRTAFAGLGYGQTAHVALAYTMQDEHGAESTAAVDVEITGDRLHAPLISGDLAGVAYEDGPRSPGGRLIGTDPDLGAVLAWSIDSTKGTFGTLTFDNGAWRYSLDNASPDVQALAQGEQATDIFTVRLTDEHDASDTRTIAVTVIGTDDAPRAPSGSTSGMVNAQATTATGQLGTADVDGTALTWSVSRSPTGYSSAYRYALDDLSIVKNGNSYFHDGFNNTLPPGPVPAAPQFADGTPAAYQGPGRYSEQGGYLVLDGALAGASTGIGVSQLVVGQPLQLMSDIDPGDPAHGLKSADSFTVEARYSLGANTRGPSDVWQSFGITLTDRAASNPPAPLTDQLGNDIVSLRAVSDRSGHVSLQLAQYDAVTDAARVLESIAVDPLVIPNPDHAVFRLAHDAAAPGTVQAAVDLVSGGNVLATFTFHETGHIFSDENWTRVQLAAFGADAGGSSVRGSYGMLSVDGAGAWTYQLDTASPAYQLLAQNAADNFTVRVTDEYGLSAFRPVSIAVERPNHNPIAISEAFTTPYDTPLRIPVSALLANDRDPDGDPLSLQFSPSAEFARDGSYIVFTPAPGSTGPSGLNYSVFDGHGGTAGAYVSVTVDPPPAPLAPALHSRHQEIVAPGASFVFSASRGNAITVSDADSNEITLTLNAGASDIDFPLGSLLVMGSDGQIYLTNGVKLTHSSPGGLSLTGTPEAINETLEGLTVTPFGDLNATTLGVEASDGSFRAAQTIALMRTSGPVDDSGVVVHPSQGFPWMLTDPLVLFTPSGLNGHMVRPLYLGLGASTILGDDLSVSISGLTGTPLLNDAASASFGDILSHYYFVPSGPVADFDLEVVVRDDTFAEATSVVGPRPASASAVIPVHIGDTAPLITVPQRQQSVPAGTELEFSAARGNAISVQDIDGDYLSVALRSSGKLVVSADTGAHVIDRGAGIGLDIDGTPAQVNAALGTLRYRSDGILPADSIEVRASDTGFFNGWATGDSVPIWVSDPVPQLTWSTPNPGLPTQLQLGLGALPSGVPYTTAVQWGDDGGQQAQTTSTGSLLFTHGYAPGLVSTLSLIPAHGELIQYRLQVAPGQPSTLNGTLANDVLIGSNFNDTISGNTGADVLVGGLGADRFVYRAAGDGGDTITDFSPSQGDKLDIRDLLVAANPSDLSANVRLFESAGNTDVQVNDGSGHFAPLVTLQGMTGLLLEQMIANGSLIAS